jgi:DNA-binding MarR family transcriptional regulator
MNTEFQALGRLVKKLQQRQHRRLDSALREVGTSLAHWDALKAIAHNPGATAHELAFQTFQTDQSFGGLATRMMEAGLIERRPGFGRAIVHQLTSAGEAMLATGNKVSNELLTEMYKSLDPDERHLLMKLIEKAIAAEQAGE